MIKLSDYLDYLHNEIIQARKKADENAIKTAKEYAEHEYLKYFKVPRFSMPTIKMDIPLKISDLDAETEYDVDVENPQFIEEVNDKIDEVNKIKDLKIPNLNLTDIKDNIFKDIFNNIKIRDNIFNRNIKENLLKSNLNERLSKHLKNNLFKTLDNKEDEHNSELNNIITEVSIRHAKPISSRLNNLFIDPDSTKTEDNNKLMVNLHVEMVEEAIRIVKMKDKDGNEIEEITFE